MTAVPSVCIRFRLAAWIDSWSRGLRFMSDLPYRLEPGDRIAAALAHPHPAVEEARLVASDANIVARRRHRCFAREAADDGPCPDERAVRVEEDGEAHLDRVGPVLLPAIRAQPSTPGPHDVRARQADPRQRAIELIGSFAVEGPLEADEVVG